MKLTSTDIGEILTGNGYTGVNDPTWKTVNGFTISLITPEQLKRVPDGTILFDIFGIPSTVGIDEIDGDTRGGYLAYGTKIDEVVQ